MRWPEIGARLILATRAVDAAYRAFDRVRSEVVLALASDAVLDRFNDLAYGRDDGYRPDADRFRAYLFPFEEQAIAAHFPPAPARILVGGAGGGREVFALAARGYEVVAFEPSPALAATLAAEVRGNPMVRVYRGGYEAMPALAPAAPGLPSGDLDALPAFDAGIVGWGSFSHLRTASQRLHTLRTFARICHGPILVSFLRFRPSGRLNRRARRLRRLLPRRFSRDPGDGFSVYIGFFHESDREEITALAAQAGLSLAHVSDDVRDTNWPHAILVPSSAQRRVTAL